MPEKTGSGFVSSNWQVIAKFGYENYLLSGPGAVIFFDEENKLGNLGYVPSNDLFSALETGDLIASEGRQLAHIESFVFDATLEPDHPLMPKDVPRIREIDRQILDRFLYGWDPDYSVLYIYVVGQTARIGMQGSGTNCPARIYNMERTPEIDYFPKELMGGFDNINKTTYKHCSLHLQSMDEPVLAHLQEDTKEVYRFLWLRSFFHPIAVRVEKNKSNYSIVTKELEGVGGYYPKKLSRQTYNELNHEQWEQIVSLIEKTRFWQTPHYRDRENLVLDGADWVLEGYRDKKYHVVFRSTPEPDGLDKDFREMCLYLLGLSDIKIPVREVY